MKMKPPLPHHSPGFGLAPVLLVIAMGGILAAIFATTLAKVSNVSTATGYLIERIEPVDKDCIRPVGKVDHMGIVL